jgi:hypothetical protein
MNHPTRTNKILPLKIYPRFPRVHLEESTVDDNEKTTESFSI